MVSLNRNQKLLSDLRKIRARNLEKDIYFSLHKIVGIWYHWDGSKEPIYVNPKKTYLLGFNFITKDGFVLKTNELEDGEKIIYRDYKHPYVLQHSTKLSLDSILRKLVLKEQGIEEEPVEEIF